MKRILSLVLTLMLLISTACAEPWTPREAPAVRMSVQEQKAILEQGLFLYAGEKNKGWYPKDLTFLQQAAPSDLLVVSYVCDEDFHAGWNIMNITVKTADGEGKADVTADAATPTEERTLVYTVQDLMEMAGAAAPAELSKLYLGLQNGGRLTGVWFLTGEVAESYRSSHSVIHTYKGELSNPNAIDTAKNVYAYIQEIWGTGCLTGQMESTWMGSPDYEMNYIKTHTGKLPAIRGLDFMNNDFQGVVNRSIAWWDKGGIPHICWHTGPDFASGYNQSQSMNIDWEKALTPGTAEYEKLLKAMDRAVPYLQQLEDEGVPVIWRPFHELDGGWFWWSKGGAEGFVKLWQLMYDRYTYYWGLDNLIWLLGYSHNGGDLAAWYPGDDYVDLIGGDSYDPGANGDLYEDVAEIAAEGMPIMFHECGQIPTAAEMAGDNAPWAMFMVWHTQWLTDELNTPESLNAVYNDEWFITLDELPFFD